MLGPFEELFEIANHAHEICFYFLMHFTVVCNSGISGVTSMLFFFTFSFTSDWLKIKSLISLSSTVVLCSLHQTWSDYWSLLVWLVVKLDQYFYFCHYSHTLCLTLAETFSAACAFPGGHHLLCIWLHWAAPGLTWGAESWRDLTSSLNCWTVHSRLSQHRCHKKSS